MYKTEYMAELAFDNIIEEINASENLRDDIGMKELIEVACNGQIEDSFSESFKGMIQDIDYNEAPYLRDLYGKILYEDDTEKSIYEIADNYTSLPREVKWGIFNSVKEQYLPEVIDKTENIFEEKGYNIDELTTVSFKEQLKEEMELSDKTLDDFNLSDNSFNHDIPKRDVDKLYEAVFNNVEDNFNLKIIDLADEFASDISNSAFENNKEETFFKYFEIENVKEEIFDELLNHMPLKEAREMNDNDLTSFVYNEMDTFDDKTYNIIKGETILNYEDALIDCFESKVNELDLDIYIDTIADLNQIKENKNLEDLIADVEIDDKEVKEKQDREIEER